jgi:long-subunit fatty acid transport protein
MGVGASYYDFSMSSVTNRFNFTTDPADRENPGGAFGAPDYSAGNIINYQSQTGDDTAYGFNFGFLWSLSSKVSVGGVYRQGPEFDVYADNVGGPAAGDDNGAVFRSTNSKFSVPDVYGLGFAIRATDAFTVAFDWARVRYSQMIWWATAIGEDGRVVGNLFPESLDDPTKILKVDDADELHLGLEYVFVNASVPVALRGGAWFDPDHKVAFPADPGDDGAQQSLAALWQPGDDQWHYSLGFGLIFGERFQLDAAADFADNATVYSLSGVLRF